MLSKHRHVVATMRSSNECVTFWVDMIYRHQLMEFYSLLKMRAKMAGGIIGDNLRTMKAVPEEKWKSWLLL
jgi:hypothetical protein